MAVATQRTGACQDQVAEAGQPRQRFALPPGGAGEPCDLGETAGDEPRLRVMAKPESFGESRRDGDDVLQRTANLDADDIARPI